MIHLTHGSPAEDAPVPLKRDEDERAARIDQMLEELAIYIGVSALSDASSDARVSRPLRAVAEHRHRRRTRGDYTVRSCSCAGPRTGERGAASRCSVMTVGNCSRSVAVRNLPLGATGAARARSSSDIANSDPSRTVKSADRRFAANRIRPSRLRTSCTRQLIHDDGVMMSDVHRELPQKTRPSWILPVVLLGIGYALVGILFARPETHVHAWRFAAWT
jgi:hypothetical protein